MSALTVIVAPEGRAEAVREALADWSQAGLIEPFVWVRAERSGGGAFPHGLEVASGSARRVDLNRVAGGYDRPDTVRVCGLSPVLTGWQSDLQGTDQLLAEGLAQGFGGLPITRLRVLLGREADPARSERIAAEGWHTVCVSPEDSTSPVAGHIRLTAAQPAGEIAIHAAAALASLLGLWRGEGTSPFDGVPPQPGRVVQLARSFFRRLDSASVEQQLRTQVLRIGDDLPLPMYQGAPLASVENVGFALSEMSERFWERHQDLVSPERFPYPDTKAEAISAWQALALFFSFLGAALRRAPANWASALVGKVSSATAGVVAGAVFGSGASAYEVVVNGVRADGTPAQWNDLEPAAAELTDALDRAGVPPEHYVRDPQHEAWRDYTDAALTLADGESRNSALPPTQIGAARGVLRRPSSIVPGARFTDVPKHLDGFAEQPPVPAYDVVGVHDLTQRLEGVAADPINGATASKSLHALQAWKQQHGQSFATYVGARLAEALTNTRREISTLLQRIMSAADPASEMELAKNSQRRNARVLMIVTWIAVALLAICVVLRTVGFVSTGVMWGIIGGLVVLWLVAGIGVFLRGQQQLFHLLNARRDLVSRLDIDVKNLRFALRDARKQSDAYAQFLAWSRALGVILQDPYGPDSTSSDGADSRLTGLPHAVGIATAHADATAIADAAYELRRDHFQRGWLTEPWANVLRSAAASLGPRGIELAGDPEAMFSQPASGRGSLLNDWTDGLANDGVPRAVGDEAMAAVLRAAESRPGLVDRLITQVTQDGVVVPAARFLTDLVAADAGIPQVLSDSLLTPRGSTTGLSQVADAKLRDRKVGLSRVVCLTQLSAPFPEYELAAFRAPVRRETPLESAPNAPGQAPSPFDGQAF